MSLEEKDMSLELSSLSLDEREELASVLRTHIENFDSVVAGDEALVIPDEVAEKIRNRVIDSVKLGDLGAEVVRFGLVGFVKVALAMVNPALNPSKFDGDEPEETAGA